jgi:hypothetical protein
VGHPRGQISSAGPGSRSARRWHSRPREDARSARIGCPSQWDQAGRSTPFFRAIRNRDTSSWFFRSEHRAVWLERWSEYLIFKTGAVVFHRGWEGDESEAAGANSLLRKRICLSRRRGQEGGDVGNVAGKPHHSGSLLPHRTLSAPSPLCGAGGGSVATPHRSSGWTNPRWASISSLCESD